MNKTRYPRSFSHIGITVPDIKKAVDFYQEVMGVVYHYGAIKSSERK